MKSLNLPTPETSRAFEAVEPVFTRHLGANRYVLGGGTVLAARWDGHRISTDLDFFTDFATFGELCIPRKALIEGDLIRSVADLGPRHLHSGLDGILTTIETCRTSLFPANFQTRPGVSSEAIGTSAVKAQTTAEILAGKIGGRIGLTGQVVVRDVYDLAVSDQLDPEALNEALSVFDSPFRRQVAGTIREAARLVGGAGPDLLDPQWSFGDRQELYHRVAARIDAGSGGSGDLRDEPTPDRDDPPEPEP